jgi:hypothetical protein
LVIFVPTEIAPATSFRRNMPEFSPYASWSALPSLEIRGLGGIAGVFSLRAHFA